MTPFWSPPTLVSQPRVLRPTALGSPRTLTVSASNPVFFSPFAPQTGAAAEASAATVAQTACTVTRVMAKITANGIATTDGVLELRIAGAMVQSVAIPKGTTGTFTISTAQAVAVNDVVSLRLDPGTGGTSLTLDGLEVVIRT